MKEQSHIVLCLLVMGPFVSLGCDGSCSCSEVRKHTTPAKASIEMPMDTKSLALSVLKGIEMGDFETVVGWFQDPPVWHEAGLLGVKGTSNREWLIERLVGLGRLLSGGRLVAETVIAIRDTVATVYVIETRKGKRTARTKGLLVLRFGFDKVTSATSYVNPRMILVQQGYISGPAPVVAEPPESPAVVEGDASFPEEFETAVFAAYEALSAGYPQPFQGLLGDGCKVVDYLTGFQGVGGDAVIQSLGMVTMTKAKKIQFRRKASIKAKEYLLIEWDIAIKGTPYDALSRADLFKIEDARIQELTIFGNATQLFGLEL